MTEARNYHSNSLPRADPKPGLRWFMLLHMLCTLFSMIALIVGFCIIALIIYARSFNQPIPQILLALSLGIFTFMLGTAILLALAFLDAQLISRHWPLQPPATGEIQNQSETSGPRQFAAPAGNIAPPSGYSTGQYSPLQPNRTLSLQEDPRAASVASTSLVQTRTGGTFVQRYGQSGNLNVSGSLLDIVSMRFFELPREGTNIEISADKSAINRSRTRFALADGVGTSFLPGHWAEIITQNFVEREKEFQDQSDFEAWLRGCSQEWHNWVNEIWLPRAIEGGGQTNWNRELERGASSTLVGCSFSWNDLSHDGGTLIQVTTVGDAIFFLVSPDPDRPASWTYNSFYLKSSSDFTQESEALGSARGRIERGWKRVHQASFPAKHNDIIVLATDALAQWIIKAQENHYDSWRELFTISSTEHFRHFVQRYRDNGLMEIDDTTVMIIPLAGGPHSGLTSN